MNDSLFDQDDLRLFREILDTQSCSGETAAMEALIVRTAESFGATVEVDERNFYVTKGEASVYPSIVAHTDTVHEVRPADQYAVRDYDGVFSAHDPVNGIPAGIGGDDKVGIFVALYLLRRLPAAKEAFFCDEEIGCVGASRARLDFFADAAFALECDRRGNADFVREIAGLALYGDDFAEAIQPILQTYGYGEVVGRSSDVGQLKADGLGIAVANMSCGYHEPHSVDEFVVLSDVERCTRLVAKIIAKLGHKQWIHVTQAAEAAD
jgi:tripeptide aminopeptidase